MIATAYVGKPAQITFTADFHELLEGDLRPGEPARSGTIRDASSQRATVVNDASKRTSEFAVSVAAIDAVEAVSVRFRIAGNTES